MYWGKAQLPRPRAVVGVRAAFDGDHDRLRVLTERANDAQRLIEGLSQLGLERRSLPSRGSCGRFQPITGTSAGAAAGSVLGDMIDFAQVEALPGPR